MLNCYALGFTDFIKKKIWIFKLRKCIPYNCSTASDVTTPACRWYFPRNSKSRLNQLFLTENNDCTISTALHNLCSGTGRQPRIKSVNVLVFCKSSNYSCKRSFNHWMRSVTLFSQLLSARGAFQKRLTGKLITFYKFDSRRVDLISRMYVLFIFQLTETYQ